MKRYCTIVLLCVWATLPLCAQRPIETLPFASAGAMSTPTQPAAHNKQTRALNGQSNPANSLRTTDHQGQPGTYPISTGGRAFCSTSTLLLSGSKYASEIDWYVDEETTQSTIHRLPSKPSHPQADPIGDIPWGLTALFAACYAYRKRKKKQPQK